MRYAEQVCTLRSAAGQMVNKFGKSLSAVRIRDSGKLACFPANFAVNQSRNVVTQLGLWFWE